MSRRCATFIPSLIIGVCGKWLAAPDAYLRDPPALDFQHFDRELIHVERLPDVRHTAQVGEQIAAERFEALALYLDAEAIGDLVDAHLAAEDEHASAFVGDGFTLDVVFIADLSDDFLEQVFDRHETCRSAVLV